MEKAPDETLSSMRGSTLPSEVHTSARLGALEVLAFRWYWILSWISSTGDGMENVIRGYLIVQLVGLAEAPFWLGMMVFAHWVPFTLFSLYGGTLADRYDNRKVQIVSQLLLLAAAIGTAVTALTNVVTVWWLLPFLLIHGFAGAVGGPAHQTLIHAMVGKQRLLSAISLSSTTRQFSQVIGPAVAGVIYVAFGAAFVVNAVTFIPLLAFLLVIRIRALHEHERQPVVNALREGVAFVSRHPLLRSLIGIDRDSTSIFVGQAFSSLLVVLAMERFPSLPLAYSSLLVASGIGAACAAGWLAYAGDRRRTAPVIVLAAALQMLAVIWFALSAEYVLALALMVLFGAATVLRRNR